MIFYVDTGNGREIRAVQVLQGGEAVGWVEANDWFAFLMGDLDAEGLLRLARLSPEPPADSAVVYAPPVPFLVERVETPDDPTGFDAGRGQP
jgi:hypothetical protein